MRELMLTALLAFLAGNLVATAGWFLFTWRSKSEHVDPTLEDDVAVARTPVP